MRIKVCGKEASVEIEVGDRVSADVNHLFPATNYTSVPIGNFEPPKSSITFNEDPYQLCRELLIKAHVIVEQLDAGYTTYPNSENCAEILNSRYPFADILIKEKKEE